MAISEELELDISGALDAIESLNEPLTALGENLTITLTTAIEAVDVQPLADQLAAIDAAGLTTTIDASIDAVDGTVPIEADTDAVPGEIDASIASADTTVTLEADTSDFGGSIDEALAAADATILIEPDVGDIAGEIEGEIQSADTTVTLEVDSSGLDEVSGDLTGLTGGVDEASDSFGGLNSSVAALAGGDALGGLTNSLGKAGPAGAAAAVGVGALTGAVLSFVNAGRDALATQQRFTATFGDLAKAAESVNLGTLNTNLDDLAIKLGSDDEGLRDAASSLFQFAEAAGFTNEQSLELVNNATALAARAVALNPALGQVGDVAATISNAFARGGKFAAKYGLSLTAAEINARALANTGKASAAELTIQEKAFAGSQIAAERYGDSLETTINKGSRNASIQQRSLNEQLNNFIEEAGKPLVAPFLELMKASLPIVKALAPIIADLGKEAIPAFAESLKQSTPAVKAFGQFMGLLGPIIGPLQTLINLTVLPVTALGAALEKFGELPDIAGFFTGIGNAIGSFLGNVVGFGADLIDSFLVGIQEAFPAVVSFFASVGSDIIDGLLGGLEAAAGAVGAFFTNFPNDQILEPIKNALGIGSPSTVMFQIGKFLIEGLVNGILSLSTSPGDVFLFILNGMINGIKSFLGIGSPSSVMFEIGKFLVLGLVNGITSLSRSPGDVFIGIMRGVIRAVRSFSSSLFGVGVDLISGLINGITRRAGDIVRVLKNRVTDVIPGFIKSALGIGSPSKVLAKIGEDIGGGLIQGLDSSLAGIEKSAAAMTAAATPVAPAVSRLPAVAATVPLSGGTAGAAAAGPVTSAQADLAGAGTGVHIGQLIVQTAAKDQTQVGIEVSRQLRAESFRAGR